MRKIGIVIGVVLLVSGCAGLGVKTEMYRIDERAESSSTTPKQTKSFACLFITCDSPRRVEGS